MVQVAPRPDRAYDDFYEFLARRSALRVFPMGNAEVYSQGVRDGHAEDPARQIGWHLRGAGAGKVQAHPAAHADLRTADVRWQDTRRAA